MPLCEQLVLIGVHLNVRDADDRTALDIAHATRIDHARLQKVSVNYWRNLRRKEKEEKDIREGKNLYVKPPKVEDNKPKEKQMRKSIWADDFDLTVQEEKQDMGDVALQLLAAKTLDMSKKKK